MSSWAEIKYALNDTLGTDKFQSFDKKITSILYEVFRIPIEFSLALRGDFASHIVIPLGFVNIEETPTLSGLIAHPFAKEVAVAVTFPPTTNRIDSWICADYVNLKSVYLPDSVLSIQERAFYNCKRLRYVFIPDSVTEIGKEAFYRCSKLEYITIGKNIKNIRTNAFAECELLTDVYYDGTISSWNWLEFTGMDSLTIHCTDGELKLI